MADADGFHAGAGQLANARAAREAFFAHRQRVKIWGEARVVEDDPALLEKLMPANQKSRAERVILFKVTAWDANCPKHTRAVVPPR